MATWQDNETDFLIDLYKLNKGRVDGMCNKNELYLEFSQTMAENGFNRDHKQIRKKIANLKNDYKKYSPGSTGSEPSKWKWFQKMHEILKTRHFYNESLTATFETADFESTQSTEDIGDIVENEDSETVESSESRSDCSSFSTPKTSKKRKNSSLDETNKKICQFLDSFQEEYQKNQEEYRINSQFLRNEISELSGSIKELINHIKNN